MKIILREKVKGLGDAGKVVNVKDGYARNYLLPKGLAVDFSEKNLKALQMQEELKKHFEDKELNQAKSVDEQLSEKSYTISVRVGEGEKLYGSVTSKDIADLLRNDGYDIDKKDILISEPIRQLGVYSIGAKLHPKFTSHFKLSVIKEEVELEEEKSDIEEPVSRGGSGRQKPKIKSKKQKAQKTKTKGKKPKSKD